MPCPHPCQSQLLGVGLSWTRAGTARTIPVHYLLFTLWVRGALDPAVSQGSAPCARHQQQTPLPLQAPGVQTHTHTPPPPQHPLQHLCPPHRGVPAPKAPKPRVRSCNGTGLPPRVGVTSPGGDTDSAVGVKDLWRGGSERKGEGPGQGWPGGGQPRVLCPRAHQIQAAPVQLGTAALFPTIHVFCCSHLLFQPKKRGCCPLQSPWSRPDLLPCSPERW